MQTTIPGQYSYVTITRRQWNTIVIGGGQAGLAAGYHLKKITDDFVILDASSRTGDSWRARWDSLQLFTPSQYNALPGWSYAATEGSAMSKDQMAEYLELYAVKFSLPVYRGIYVISLAKNEEGFLLKTNNGSFCCNNVIVATGTHQRPYLPSFTSWLNPDIVQLHAAAYRNPSDLPLGKVLVVGSATSGIEIALEVSRSRRTMIAGKPSFVIPAGAFRLGPGFYWWFINTILTIKTPIGRKARPGIIKGGAVIPQVLDKLKNSSVLVLPRVTGVKDGMPLLEDGRTIPVSAIIWCTGYRPDFTWIDIRNCTGKSGWPVTKRGVSVAANNLYFVGMPFQYGLTSGLVGGVGRDAAYVVNKILKNKMKMEKIQQYAKRKIIQ